MANAKTGFVVSSPSSGTVLIEAGKYGFTVVSKYEDSANDAQIRIQSDFDGDDTWADVVGGSGDYKNTPALPLYIPAYHRIVLNNTTAAGDAVLFCEGIATIK